MVEEEKQTLLDILRGNVGVLTWTRILLFFPRQLHEPYFSLYIAALGGSPQAIGLVGSMVSLAGLIIAPIAGHIADRYGRVKLIASSFYLRSFAYLTYALSGSWHWLATGKFYQGLTEYNHAAQSAITADSLKPGSRGLGFAVFNQLYKVATIFAPPLGAFVITQFGLESGMRYLLFVSFVAMFFVGLSRQKLLKETIKSDELEQKSSHINILAMIKESYRSAWETLKYRTSKGLVIFVVIRVLSSFSAAMVGSFWVVYAKEIIELTVTEWGTILFVQGLTGILISVPAGILVDKIGKKRIIVTMLFLSLFPGILFTYCQTFVQTLAIQISLIVIASFLQPAAQSLMADMVPRTVRARMYTAFGRGEIGIMGGGFGVGAGYVLAVPILFGSMTGGFVYSVNPSYPWMIQAVSLLVALIIGIRYLKEPEVAEL